VTRTLTVDPFAVLPVKFIGIRLISGQSAAEESVAAMDGLTLSQELRPTTHQISRETGLSHHLLKSGMATAA